MSGNRKFGGILDYNTLKSYKLKDGDEKTSKKLIRTTSNFEKAHLKAYLKGYKYFTFHGNIFEVKDKDENEENISK